MGGNSKIKLDYFQCFGQSLTKNDNKFELVCDAETARLCFSDLRWSFKSHFPPCATEITDLKIKKAEG